MNTLHNDSLGKATTKQHFFEVRSKPIDYYKFCSTQRHVSSKVSHAPNGDHMTKLRPWEVGCLTPQQGPQTPGVPSPGLGFWLFRFSPCC